MQPTRKYELYSSEFRSQAHKVYARMRVEDPVILQPGLGGKTPIWFVTRYDDVEQVLLDDRRFARDPTLAYTPEEIEHLFGPSDPVVDALVNHHMPNRDGEDHRFDQEQ